MPNFPTSVSTDANLYVAVNGLQTTLAAPALISDTTLTLTSTTGFPTTGLVTVDNNEVVSYTGVSGPQLTGCTRGADGTSALPHSTGVTVALTVVAAHHNLLKYEIIAVEGALGSGFAKGNLTAGTSKIAVTGGTNAVIGAGATVDLGTVNIDDLADVTASTPSASDVLQWNGTMWVNAPGSSASAGNGIEFFMDDAVIVPTGVNNDNELNTLLRVPAGGAEVADTVVCNNNTVLAEGHLYDVALNRTQFDAGVWDFDTWAGVSNAAAVSQILINMCRVRAGTGTLTVTGAGTSRTATASSGTPFNTTDIDASATVDVGSYIQTPTGYFLVTARTSDTVITVTTPTTYTNETAVAYNVWKRLFQVTTGEINNISPSYVLFNTKSIQPSFSCIVTDKIGEMVFGTTTRTSNTTITHVHNGTDHYSHVATPLATLHNDLAGLQGGSSTERYHLTSAELAIAQAALVTTGGTMTGDITMSNNKAVILKETTGSGTDAVTLKAPASVTTSYTLQLPPALSGTTNQVLTDAAGDGVLSWSAGGGGLSQIQSITYTVGSASGTYTGSTTLFNLPFSYTQDSKSLQVFYNGQVLVPGNDYTETTTNSVTMTTALVSGAIVVFRTITAGTQVVGAVSQFINYMIGTASGTYNGSLTQFDLPFAYQQDGKTLNVYYDGVKLTVADDYTESTSTRIITTTSLVSGRKIQFQALSSAGVAPSVTNLRENYVVGTASGNYTGSTTVFALLNSYTPGGVNLQVYLDGDLQTVGASIDYVETNSTTVTFNNALVSGQKVTFVFSQTVASGGTVSSGAAAQAAYYASTGSTVSSTSAVTIGSNGPNAILTGTNTNDSAATGVVGEYVESIVSSFTNAPTSGQYGDLTTISLTAGDWDVTIVCEAIANGAGWTRFDFGIGTTSGNSAPLTGTRQQGAWASSSTQPSTWAASSYHRLSISGTTSVYLKYLSSYPSGNPQGVGKICARRVR